MISLHETGSVFPEPPTIAALIKLIHPGGEFGNVDLAQYLHFAGERWPGVAPGDCSPGAPTDPDVQISRIRFLKS